MIRVEQRVLAPEEMRALGCPWAGIEPIHAAVWVDGQEILGWVGLFTGGGPWVVLDGLWAVRRALPRVVREGADAFQRWVVQTGVPMIATVPARYARVIRLEHELVEPFRCGGWNWPMR